MSHDRTQFGTSYRTVTDTDTINLFQYFEASREELLTFYRATTYYNKIAKYYKYL